MKNERQNCSEFGLCWPAILFSRTILIRLLLVWISFAVICWSALVFSTSTQAQNLSQTLTPTQTVFSTDSDQPWQILPIIDQHQAGLKILQSASHQWWELWPTTLTINEISWSANLITGQVNQTDQITTCRWPGLFTQTDWQITYQPTSLSSQLIINQPPPTLDSPLIINFQWQSDQFTIQSTTTGIAIVDHQQQIVQQFTAAQLSDANGQTIAGQFSTSTKNQLSLVFDPPANQAVTSPLTISWQILPVSNSQPAAQLNSTLSPTPFLSLNLPDQLISSSAASLTTNSQTDQNHSEATVNSNDLSAAESPSPENLNSGPATVEVNEINPQTQPNQFYLSATQIKGAVINHPPAESVVTALEQATDNQAKEQAKPTKEKKIDHQLVVDKKLLNRQPSKQKLATHDLADIDESSWLYKIKNLPLINQLFKNDQPTAEFFGYLLATDPKTDQVLAMTRAAEGWQQLVINPDSLQTELWQATQLNPTSDDWQLKATALPVFQFQTDAGQWQDYIIKKIDLPQIDQQPNLAIITQPFTTQQGPTGEISLKIGFDGQNYLAKWTFKLNDNQSSNRLIWQVMPINASHDQINSSANLDEKNQPPAVTTPAVATPAAHLESPPLASSSATPTLAAAPASSAADAETAPEPIAVPRQLSLNNDQLQIDWQDFAGAARYEQHDDQYWIYFYETGQIGALTIDPTLSLSTPTNQVQVDVPNHYRAIIQTNDTEAIIRIYDRAENDSSPDLVAQFIGLVIRDENIYYQLGYDATRTTSILETDGTKVKVRIQGCLDTAAGGACLKNVDSSNNQPLTAIEEYTFTTEGFFVKTAINFHDGWGYDKTTYTDQVWPFKIQIDTDAAGIFSETIYYGDGATEASRSTSGSCDAYDDTYVNWQATGSYQDIILGTMVLDEGQNLSNGVAWGGYSYYTIDEYGERDSFMFFKATAQTLTNWGQTSNFFLLKPQTATDTEAEREAIFNDLTNPDSITYTTGTPWTDGYRNKGLLFDGSNDYVRIPTNSALQFGTGSFSVEAWIYPQTQSGTTGTIINTRGTGTSGSYAGWQLAIGNNTTCGTGKWCVDESAIDDAGSNFKNCDHCGASYDLNQWHHLAMVYTADQDLKFYVNGKLDSVVEVGSYGSISNSLPTAIGAAIAASGTEGSKSLFFNGIIDEVRLWNTARTIEEIQASLNNQLTGSESGLAGYWRLSDNAGTTANDQTSNNNDGTLGGGTSDYQPRWFTGYLADFYDEAENSYPIDIAGGNLQIDLNGGTNNRLLPNLKIRGYRSSELPDSVTLEGSSLTAGTHYNANLKPISSANFASDLIWSSTMENQAAVENPEIGTSSSSGLVGGSFTIGKFGQGFLADASGEYVAIPMTDNLSATAGTIEFWFRDTGTQGTYARFFCSSKDSSAGDAYFSLYRNAADTSLIFKVNNSTTSTWSSVPTVFDGDWHHLRLTYDTVNNSSYLYIDNLSQGQSTTNHDSIDTNYNLTIGNQEASDLNIGGIIDDFKIYSSVVGPQSLAVGGFSSSSDEYLGSSSQDFSLAFNAVDSARRGEYFYLGADAQFSGVNIDLETLGIGSNLNLDWQYWSQTGSSEPTFVLATDSNLVSFWDLDESSDSLRLDGIGNNDLTESTSDTIVQSYHRMGGAASGNFESGDSEYLEISDGSQTGLDLTTAMSISLWYRPETVSGTQTLISKYLNTTNNCSYVLNTYNDQVQFNLYASGNPSGTKANVSTPTGVLTAGSWAHIVAVYTGSEAKIFVNGVLQDNGSSNPVTYSSDIYNSSAPFLVGATNSDGLTNYADGLIDEVAIFSDALTTNEINEIFNQRSATYAWRDLAVSANLPGADTLTADGNINFTVPSDWSLMATTNSPELYFVRARLLAGSYTTSPIENLITTDILSFQYLSTISSNSQTLAISQNDPPATVTLTNRPFDNEVLIDTTPEFNFESTDGNGDDLEYQIQIDDSANFGSTVVDADSTSASGFANTENGSDTHPFTSGQNISYTVSSALTNNTTYYWRVRAKDPSGTNAWNDWTAVRSYTVNTALSVGAAWLQTTDDQLDDNTLTGVSSDPSNNRLKLAGSWWNSNWSRRRTITFNNSAQSSNLTNFTILVRLTDPTNIDYDYVQNDYDDLRFIDADNATELDYEVEVWNESGESIVWVEVPQIDASSTTDYIYMYYGNTSATAGEDATGTWSNSYAGVWHLKESSGTYYDSTSNNNDSTAVSVTARTAAGKIGSNVPEFNGTSNYITVADATSLDLNSYTIEAWMDADDTDAWRTITAKGATDATFNWYLPFYTKYLYLRNGYSSTYQVNSTATYEENTWLYVAGKVDNANTALEVYKNGASVGNATSGGASDNNNDVMYIGRNAPWGEYFDGHIDELRISSVARSDDWMAAQYASMNSSFNTYGSEATYTGTALSELMDFSWVTGAQSWGQVYWTDDETSGDIKIKVYYNNSGTPTIIPDSALTSNSSGFDTSPIDISGLSTSTYSQLYLYATFTGSSGTPYLNDWQITIDENSAPNSPTDLYCDDDSAQSGQSSPVTGLIDHTPTFSAIFDDADTSDTATHYEIEIGDDSNWDDGAEMWDSGQTSLSSCAENNRCGDITYNGSTLVDGTTYYWRLRFWDNNGAVGAWSTTVQFTMNQAATITNVSLNSGQNLSLTENTTTNISWTATVTDADGYSDINTVSGKMYRSGVTNAQACAVNNQNCYSDASCELSSCSGNSCTATCQVAAQFFADPTDADSTYASEYWLGWMSATDQAGEAGTGFSPNSTTDLQSLLALAVNDNLAFGQLLPGDNTGSTNSTTTITNTGNRIIDTEISGDDLCPDYPTCAGSSIPVGNLEFKANSFTYNAGTDLTTSGQNVDLNIAQPSQNPSNTTGMIYWGIAIPSVLATGNYSTNTSVIAVDGT